MRLRLLKANGVFLNLLEERCFVLDPDGGAMVGFAKTAKIAAIEPPKENPEIIKERRMNYYRYMSEINGPTVVVIEDLDFPNCIGAYWGEINTKVHKGFGLSGALTNGVMRDLGDLAEDFPVVAGSIGPSHGFVHVREIDTPVNVFGMTVNPGRLNPCRSSWSSCSSE